MTITELETLARQQLDTARQHLEATGAWRPTAIVVEANGGFTYWDFADALEHRSALAAHIRDSARDSATAVLLVSDAWMGKFPKDMTKAEVQAERERLPPSIADWPDDRRSEALIVSAFCPAGSIGLQWVYQRDGERVVGGEVQKADDVQSRWSPWQEPH